MSSVATGVAGPPGGQLSATARADRAFPAGFRWGTATSAYQIEGAYDEDGRGPSVWDAFAREPFRIADGSSGDVACDHYHRMPEDVALMRAMGLGAYRFSVAWPRIVPDGRGPVNAAGLAFYDRLVDELLEAAIAPYVTLNHWDTPLAVQEHGGWANRATIDAFVDYASTMFDRLGDRVEGWLTHNEPWCQAFLGHGTGHHAPGLCDMSTAFQVAHHLLVAHGRTVAAFRASGAAGRIGIALNPQWYVPATESEADHAARDRVWANSVDLFLGPIVHGEYPGGLIRFIGPHAPDVQPGDLATISQPIDYLGVNYYNAERVAWDVEGSVLRARSEPLSEPGFGRTAMGWGIAPSGLTAVLMELQVKYPDLPIMITENGCALDDEPGPDGVVDDQDRIAYLDSHIGAVAHAIEAGVDVRGYFAWSLLDNFEWAWGYTKRFGLVRTEPRTGRRIPKASAHWYSSVVLNGGRARDRSGPASSRTRT